MEPTHFGVLGSGDVGRSLAGGLARHGHEVTIGSRDPGKLSDWAAEHGVHAGTFAEAADAQLVILAVKGVAVEEAIEQAERERFAGKVVIDATNPLDFSSGGPGLAFGHSDSGGETVQRVLPDARVVKAFNTVNYGLMIDPELPGGPHPMFIAGNDAEAKGIVGELLRDAGWEPFDVGGIEQSRQLEALVLLWVAVGSVRGAWDHAFTLVAKS